MLQESPKWRSYLLEEVWYSVRSGAGAVECTSKMACPSRKRLKTDLFSPKLVNVRLTAKKQLSAEIDSHVAFFQSTDLTTVENTKENDVLLILMSKLTLNDLTVGFEVGD